MLKFAKAAERKERYSASSVESYQVEDRGKRVIYRKASTEQSSEKREDDIISVSSFSSSINVSRNNSFHKESNDSPTTHTDDEISPREILSIRNIPREPFDFHRNRSYSSISEEDVELLKTIDQNENVIISNVRLTKQKPNKSENSGTSRKCYVVGKQPNRKKKTDSSSTEFNYGKLDVNSPHTGYTAESMDLNSLDVFENYTIPSPHCSQHYNITVEKNTSTSQEKGKSKKDLKNKNLSEIKKSSSFKDKMMSPLMSRKFFRSSTLGANRKKEKPPMRRCATDEKISPPKDTRGVKQGAFSRFSDVRQNVRRSSKKRNSSKSHSSSKSSSLKSNDSFDDFNDDTSSILTTVSADDEIFEPENFDMSPLTYSDQSFSADSEFQEFDADRLTRIFFRKQRLRFYKQNEYVNNARDLTDRIRNFSAGSSADSQYGGSCSSLSANSLHFTSSTDVSILPDALLLLIFTYLSTREICRVSQVCKRWHSLYLSEQLWQKIDITNAESLDIDSILEMILKRLSYNTSCLNIQQIKLDGCLQLTDCGLKTIATRCPELRAFEIAACLEVTAQGVLHILKNCPNLMFLNLSKCENLTGFSSHFKSKTTIYEKMFGELRYLDVSSCSLITDNDLSSILRCVVSLEYIYIRQCDCISDVGLESIAKYCSNLKEISLNDCVNITDKGVVKLIQNCQYVRYLSLAKCPITNKVLDEIFTSRSSYLRHLNLYECEFITDTGIMKLSAVCSRLRSLDIGKCMKLTDASLYGLSRCVLLRRLNLKCCINVTDAGIRKLATNCKNLRHLDLRGCTFSAETILYIQKHCSRCAIEELSAHLC